ncbi:DNA (cytosine-5-)-methyltransferase [Halobaculum sp. WSA2]|uniref:DNA (cytosine-5-)-methyltransferase n=1 Tax=Halobaculum saliterrae TaxID=2073113 RepID=A0A6B0SLN0_9EURY|nr:DNA cytosine methyltransferase [Halobaculum saliterrae]MXR39814.1 DNA (cytosine-5-)-methyltransferase [Halobaculum saliterrae]
MGTSDAKPKAVDLFCGAGGASMGLLQAGFEVVGAVDADESALDVYSENLCGSNSLDFSGEVTFNEPLRADLSRDYTGYDTADSIPTVTFADIRDHFGIETGEIDLICGCPPCQNFSALRDTDPWPDGEPKDELLRAFVEFVEEEVPPLVLFENVSNIVNAGDDVPTAYVDWLLRRMGEINRDDSRRGGYGRELSVLNAADYGVPQRRRRSIGAFVYGVDDDSVTLPDPTHANPTIAATDREDWVTVDERINRDDLKEDLELGHAQTGIDGFPDDPAHRSRRHHDSTVQMIQAIRKHGGSWKDLRGTDDEDKIKDCHQDLSTGAASAYGIMAADEPAPTLTTRCTNVSSGRFTHPRENRAITFREAALLMGFPESFSLPSINEKAERVIGNAVPPQLIRAVATTLVESFPSMLHAESKSAR